MDITVEKNVAAKMRDGTVLRADVYRPADGEHHPVLLQRTPYSKELLATMLLTLDPIRAASAGYAVVIQDVRGRFTSDGDPFFYYRAEFEDGFDSVEWAASQPFCDGRVALYGPSYMGGTTWQAAVAAPPSLTTVVPTTAPADQFSVTYPGGAYNLGLYGMWALAAIGPGALTRLHRGPELAGHMEALVDDIDALESWYRHLPLKEFPPAHPDEPDFVGFFFETINHPNPGPFWESMGTAHRRSEVKVPALIVAGWHDIFLRQDLAGFAAMREHAGSELARRQTRIIVGPWSHGMFQNVVGDVDYGLRAALIDLREDITSLHLRWFNRWLKDEQNGFDEEPPVRLFVQGVNRWRHEDAWPLARAKATPCHLAGGGALTFEPPATDSEPDTYVYDPEDPCPTRGGPLVMPKQYGSGPVEQRLLIARDDVLFYATAPLDSPLEVTGPVNAVLYAATTAADTDWMLKLCDVAPDGRVLNITDGVLRASYREDAAHPSPVTPGNVVRYEVDMAATSIVFQPGHRIGLMVTSSDFPRYDRNLNTGASSRDSTAVRTARQTIFHDAQRPSHLVLPVVR